jgi:hypothetical protein
MFAIPGILRSVVATAKLTSHLVEEEASSLALKEQSANLQETMYKIVSDQSESFHNAALVQLDELGRENKIVSDSYVSELESRLVEEEAASLIHRERSVYLQETIEKMVAEKISVDDLIVELMTEAETNKVSAVGLQETIDKTELGQTESLGRIAALESQITRNKSELHELAVAFSELKSRLIEEEAASLILKEHSISLQETIDEMELDQTESLDHIIALESQITSDKTESDVLAEHSMALKSRFAEQIELGMHCLFVLYI